MHCAESSPQVVEKAQVFEERVALLQVGINNDTVNQLAPQAELRPRAFHERGRRVGGRPQVIIERRGKEHKRPKTSKNPPNQKQKPETKNHHGQRPIPPHLSAFPLYEGETCENDKS